MDDIIGVICEYLKLDTLENVCVINKYYQNIVWNNLSNNFWFNQDDNKMITRIFPKKIILREFIKTIPNGVTHIIITEYFVFDIEHVIPNSVTHLEFNNIYDLKPIVQIPNSVRAETYLAR